MRRVASRAICLWCLIGLLLGGLGLFGYDYAKNAEDWVFSTGNPHIYDEHGVAFGTILDRADLLLLDMADGGTYSPLDTLRKSTLHWVGDRQGNINAPILTQYKKELAGFSFVDGIYSYGGVGGRMKLTLSAALQVAALEALGDQVGTVAVMNYKTGEILCAVTTPTFDPDNLPDIAGDTIGAYEGVYWNRFTQSAYIPGSIFKVVTTAAALEEIPDIMEQTFTCTGRLEFGIDHVSCERSHGELTLTQAMTRSCNCAYAQIALQLGAEKLQEYVDKYAVTQRLSFDGITTAAGNFSVLNQADVQVAWSAIGQHLDQINPCRFLTFVAAVANGGNMVEPYLVQSVTCGSSVTYSAPAQVGSQIMSAKTAAIMQNLMRNNVLNNYGADNFPGLTVCAKSGTGEVGGGKKPNAMFTGFVADEEYPIAFIVAVENAGYGKTVCVPILAKVLAACKEVLDNP